MALTLVLTMAIPPTLTFAQGSDDVRGTVRGADGSPMPYAVIAAYAGNTLLGKAITDAEGNYSMHLVTTDSVTIEARHIGHETHAVRSAPHGRVDLTLRKTSLSLDEVTVTARESASATTSTTTIDATAMAHLQPTSLTDLLSLLPGGETSVPEMGRANRMALREVGTADSNYGTSALGTQINIDGHTLGTDADMLRLDGTQSQSPAYKRDNTAFGIDLRSIGTDDIESVEIIRGIPSARYGEVTSGVVNISRRMGVSPWNIRIKADHQSKMAYASKGFGGRHGWQTTLSADLLNAHADPRNPYEEFWRIGLSARTRRTWVLAAGTLKMDGTADIQRTADDVKSDPEQSADANDRYANGRTRISLGVSLKWRSDRGSWGIKNTFSYSADEVEQQRRVRIGNELFVSNANPTPADSNGISAAALKLPNDYVALHRCESRPLYNTLSLTASTQATSAFGGITISHALEMGAEWRHAKNHGAGQVYDRLRPVNPTDRARRPRAYSDLAASNIVSLYAEDAMSARVGAWRIGLNIGARVSMMTGLGSEYDIDNRPYADPRLSMSIGLPAMGRASIGISGGFGLMSKMPTIEMLQPDLYYVDIAEMNHWDGDPSKRLTIYRTYACETRNFGLRPATSRKGEIRIFGHIGTKDGNGRNTFSISIFAEETPNAFRQISRPRPFNYNKMSADNVKYVDGSDQPVLEGLMEVPTSIIKSIPTTSNASLIAKRGIEWQYTSPRLARTCTRISAAGAWKKTTYENSDGEWYAGSDAVILGTAVKDQFIGYYDWRKGTTHQRTTTTLTTESFVDKIDLIISLSAEVLLHSRYRMGMRHGAPKLYMGTDGAVRPYTAESARDPWLSTLTLVNKQGDTVGDERPRATFNVKATKRIGNIMTLSFFADRLIAIARDNKVNGTIVRRTFKPYFGMTLDLKL